MTKLSTTIDLKYVKQSKALQEIKCEKMWVKYELWDKPVIWLSDINKYIKATCLSGKREYEYPAPTIADVIDNSENLFNGIGFYWINNAKIRNEIMEIFTMCFENKSIDEIGKYIISNIEENNTAKASKKVSKKIGSALRRL